MRNRHAQVGDRVFKDNTIMHVDIVLTKVLDYRSDNIITMDVDYHKIIEEYYTTPRLPIMDGIDDHTKFTHADGTTSETNADMISVLVKMMRFGNM